MGLFGQLARRESGMSPEQAFMQAAGPLSSHSRNMSAADVHLVQPATGVRSFDIAGFSIAPHVTGVLPSRQGVAALVRDRVMEQYIVDVPELLDHVIIVPLEAFAVKVKSDTAFHDTLAANSATLLPCGMASEWRALSGAGSVIHLHVAASRVAALAQSEPCLRRCGRLIPVFNRLDTIIASIAHAVRDEIHAARPGCRVLIESLFQALCVQLLRAYSAGQATEDSQPLAIAPYRLRRALNFIEDNLAESIGLEDIAAAAGLSPYHFSRCFKQAVGLPPYRYVRIRRVERARVLVEKSRDSIAEIALACGFATQQHLTQMFREHLGTSPGRYRQQRLGLEDATVSGSR